MFWHVPAVPVSWDRPAVCKSVAASVRLSLLEKRLFIFRVTQCNGFKGTISSILYILIYIMYTYISVNLFVICTLLHYTHCSVHACSLALKFRGSFHEGTFEKVIIQSKHSKRANLYLQVKPSKIMIQQCKNDILTQIDTHWHTIWHTWTYTGARANISFS